MFSFLMLFLSYVHFLFVWKALRIHASFSFEVKKSTSSLKRAILLLLATVNNAWREVNISAIYSFPSFSLGSSPSDKQLQSRRERGTQRASGPEKWWKGSTSTCSLACQTNVQIYARNWQISFCISENPYELNGINMKLPYTPNGIKNLTSF